MNPKLSAAFAQFEEPEEDKIPEELLASPEWQEPDFAPTAPPMVEAAPSPMPSREDALRRVLEKQTEFEGKRAGRIKEAAQKDRQAQSQADVREYLRAAFTRQNPNLRNVGKSHTQEVMAEGNTGPLSRELQLQALLQKYETKPVNPLDDNLKRAQISNYEALQRLHDRQGLPKPPAEPKPEKVDPLLEEKRLKLKAETERLARQPTAKPDKAAAHAVEGLPSEYESATATRGQREKFAEVVSKAGKAKAITQRLRSMLQEAGLRRLQPGDPLATRIASEAAKLDIEVKNVAELGALSGPDTGLIRRVIADPNSVTSVIRDLPAQLDAIESWGDDAISATAKGSNITRRGGGTSSEVQIRNGDSVLWISPADLKDAEKDGFKATGKTR